MESRSDIPHSGQISLKAGKNVRAQAESCRRATTIDMLSDDVLLEIFDSCRKCRDYTCHDVWKWHLLVHVCQRWRQVIFASPHRLNLQLLCTSGTPVRRNLSIWLPFPIAMEYFFFLKSGLPPEDEDNVIVALKHPNRVCYVKLGLTNPQLGRVATAMQEPFPVL